MASEGIEIEAILDEYHDALKKFLVALFLYISVVIYLLKVLIVSEAIVIHNKNMTDLKSYCFFTATIRLFSENL